MKLAVLGLISSVALVGLTSCVKRSTTNRTTRAPSQPDPNLNTNPQPDGSLHGSEADYALVPPDKQIRWSYASMPTPAPASKPNYLLRSFNFPSGGSSFDEEAQSVLREVGVTLKGRSNARVLVVGLTDAVDEKVNAQNLGMKRAEAVRSRLVAEGVAKDRIATASFGSSLAEARPDQPLGQQQDRRVEIWVVSE